MKTSLILLLGSAAILLAQAPVPPLETVRKLVRPPEQRVQEGELTRFDLKFPGGTPQELVDALGAAMGKQVNVVFTDSVANLRLPAIRVRNASVKDLFSAIEKATRREVPVPTAIAGSSRGFQNYSVQYRVVQFQFLPADNVITDDTVWSFVSDEPEILKASESARELRHFQLGDYLSDSLSVEDITTAIRTGWDMLGTKNPPELKFHKETGIMIASGDPRLLDQIPMVLQQLPRAQENHPADPTSNHRPGVPVSPPGPPQPNLPPTAPKPAIPN